MKRYLSLAIIFIIIIIVSVLGKNVERWKHNEIINNDAVMYYAYLPAFCIYHDLTFQFVDSLPDDFKGRIWTFKAPNGNTTLKMTMGLAIGWIPFFYMAHLYTMFGDYPSDGYSEPYSVSIFVAAIFFLFVGLFFLRKLLLPFFEEKIIALVMIIVVFGTNLFRYVVDEPGMPHVYSFAWINMFLYFVYRWIQKPSWSLAIWLGITAGLATLIRPANGIILLFPFILILFSKGNLIRKGNIRALNLKTLSLSALFFFLMCLPQLIYWKTMTGNWLFYSYQDEGFYFLNPHILDGLFSYRKGWFIYTPVMLFSIIGFFFTSQNLKDWRNASLIFLSVFIFIVFSWWCWWYGGSFGARPMIDIYGILAIGLAAFINKIFSLKKVFIKLLFLIVLAFFIYLNQYQIKQYRTSLLHWDSMTKEVYYKILFTQKWPDGYDKMIQTPNYEKAKKGIDEY